MSIAAAQEDLYENRYWESDDGLKLHYRDYQFADNPQVAKRSPIICIPGLTRNARDFAHLGQWMAARPKTRQRRIIIVNLRGRGMSEYAKDSATYNPKTYAADILKLMNEEEISKAVFIGTSLGGIVTMIEALSHRERLAGAVLNDIGPELEPTGLRRIAESAGQSRSFDTWVHAARDLAENSRNIHPDFSLNEWISFAKKLYQMTPTGRIKLDYDMKITDTFDSKGGGSGALWKALEVMKDVPVLILRGGLSDLFSDKIARKMFKQMNDAELVTVEGVGHAPSLEEPASLDAIARLLQRAG